MRLQPSMKVWRALPTAVFAASLVLCLGYLYLSPHDFVHEHVPGLPSWPGRASSLPSGSPPPPLPLPDDYTLDTPASAFCDDRFNSKYLTDLRSTAFQYCNASSYSSLTCFHSHTSNDEERDSLCIAKGSVFDAATGKFVLNCDFVQPDANDTARGVIPFQAVRSYWYDTGPRSIFDNHVDFIPENRVAVIPLEEKEEQQKRFTLLLKREGEMNPWHCLLEVWSMAMTMDVLRIARDPADPQGAPFLRTPDDVSNVQVVILDDRLDGPYYGLWKLFSGRDPIRLNQIKGNPEAFEFFNNTEQHLIVPLAGASNPTWQNDWLARDCTRSDTLRAFVGRVLGFYGVSDSASSEIRVTFIDRKDTNTRRLADQDRLLDALRTAYPEVVVEVVDFGTLTFAEQLQKARETDVLVGVHGAGLTHTMFLREYSTAVVEIQPADMGATFMGFRNLANMRGVGYFRTNANPVNKTAEAEAAAEPLGEVVGDGVDEVSVETGAVIEPAGEKGDPTGDKKERELARRAAWHTENFALGSDAFVHVVGAAIESVYNKGLHQNEVV